MIPVPVRHFYFDSVVFHHSKRKDLAEFYRQRMLLLVVAVLRLLRVDIDQNFLLDVAAEFHYYCYCPQKDLLVDYCYCYRFVRRKLIHQLDHQRQCFLVVVVVVVVVVVILLLLQLH